MRTHRCCHPERDAVASCRAKDLGAPIRVGARKARILFALILLITMSSLTLAAQTPAPVVLRGGKLLTVSHGVIENGVLVMENGKITALGKAGEVAIPKGARVLDVKGMTVYPGLIDSQTNLGLTEISAVAMTNDLVEPSDEITPHMHVYDAFHAESELIPVTRLNGITNAIVAPAETNTLPGQASLVQLDGRSRDEMLVVRDLALMMNFTGAQRRNQTWDSRKFPQTRMGLAAQLRQAFLDAQDYRQRRQEYEQRKAAKEKDPTLKDKERPKRDLRLEALLPYLDGKKPVVLAAAEPSDVEVALSLAREFNLQVVLNHITHSLTLLDKIAEAKLPVIVGPIYTTPKDNERYDVVYRLPAELARRGIKFAFASYDAHDVRNLPYAAGYAVAWGVPYDQALKALTLNPAEIWGVAAQLGSLDAGKTANIVVADGDPLDVRTDVKRLFIAGREVPLTSRQTALREAYMN